MLVKGKYLLREKAKEGVVKVGSPTGVHLATSVGSQMVAHKDIIVQSIIQGDSQDDVQSVALLVTILLDAHVRSSPKPRMPSGMTPPGKKKSNGRSSHERLKSMKLPRARKVKGRDLNLKESLRARVHRDRSHQDRLSPRLLEMTDPNPKPNLMPALA